ncbi:putative serine/threonine-protein kinase [Trichinella pseudospiralis]|uniref:Putative serine/threonine-protein kinase n=1 Tax=Trichinella pseudospiralis TaxID=6337 RepID=A0A0V1EYE9_TRIPS|nr:putative serine/threonine-protein kinase [Trichinella pseudospiralis]
MPKKEISLEVDTVINNRWTVMQKLGEGSYGLVYQVKDECGQHYAMKIEEKEKQGVLATEAMVLSSFQDKKHGLKLVEYYQLERFNFMVMTLAGKNLTNLRRSMKNRKFSLETTVNLGIQMMEAIRDLHEIGYLHRDVKGSNYGIGINADDKRNVYLIDFGMARRYKTERGQLIPPRSVVAFRGTVRYASPHCHARKDYGRRDDLYSWLYTLVEFRRGYLQWRNANNEDEVARMKNQLMPSEILGNMPRQFYEILAKLNVMTFSETPNYNWFISQLMNVLKSIDKDQTAPFDWEIANSSSSDQAVLEDAENKQLIALQKPACMDNNGKP